MREKKNPHTKTNKQTNKQNPATTVLKKGKKKNPNAVCQISLTTRQVHLICFQNKHMSFAFLSFTSECLSFQTCLAHGPADWRRIRAFFSRRVCFHDCQEEHGAGAGCRREGHCKCYRPAFQGRNLTVAWWELHFCTRIKQ